MELNLVETALLGDTISAHVPKTGTGSVGTLPPSLKIVSLLVKQNDKAFNSLWVCKCNSWWFCVLINLVWQLWQWMGTFYNLTIDSLGVIWLGSWNQIASTLNCWTSEKSFRKNTLLSHFVLLTWILLPFCCHHYLLSNMCLLLTYFSTKLLVLYIFISIDSDIM